MASASAKAFWHSYSVFLALLLSLSLVSLIILVIRRRSKLLSNRQLRGKHVFITGGSGGIGIAIARRCAAEGAYLTLVSRSLKNLESARQSLLDTCPSLSPDSILLKAADVSNSNAIAVAVKESFEWRPIDVLVCNAGMAFAGMFDESQLEDMERCITTNILGCVYPIHAVLPLMKERSLYNASSIVLVGSVAGMSLLYGANIYTPTKYAIKGLAELLRFELLPWKINISLICPGYTKTSMLEEFYNPAPTFVQRIVEKITFYDPKAGVYNPKAAEPVDNVASHTIYAIKSGEFLVPTTIKGFMLRTLGRGCFPSENITTFVVELIWIIPLRLLSFVWLFYAKRVILNECKMDNLAQEVKREKPMLATVS